jgi:hypothetical protein
VTAVREQLKQPALVHAFDAVLSTTYGLDTADLSSYSAPIKLRTLPYLVPVDADFPRVVAASRADGAAVVRISDIRYRVDVEGLGFVAGSPRFDEVVGGLLDVVS